MKIALVHEIRPSSRVPVGGPDLYAEFEQMEAVQELARTIEDLGHGVTLVDSQNRLVHTLGSLQDIDLVFNYSVGHGSRSRESLTPAVCELLGMPYTGSDAMANALASHKHAAKLVAERLGILTPRWIVIAPGEALPSVPFEEAVVKLMHEGSSIGLSGPFRFGDPKLHETVQRTVLAFGQPILVEEFIAGEEITLPILGNAPGKALPPVRLEHNGNPFSPHDLFSGDLKVPWPAPGFVPGLGWGAAAGLSPESVAAIQHAGVLIHDALGCRDFSRVDFRVDQDRRPFFLELNTTPQLSIDGGAFVVSGALAGITYPEIIKAIIDAAVERVTPRTRLR